MVKCLNIGKHIGKPIYQSISNCNNVNNVKNNVIFEPPSIRACSSTPPKQNQDFVQEHNMTPLNELCWPRPSLPLGDEIHKDS